LLACDQKRNEVLDGFVGKESLSVLRVLLGALYELDRNCPRRDCGFDCDTPLTASIAEQFYAQGYKFCFRYLSLDAESVRDLSASEAIDILNSGVALMPVQHVRKQGWSANQSLGQGDGQNAVSNVQDVGFPSGVNVWCDLEGVSSNVQLQDVIDYCQAWQEAVNMAGYVPGLYVGAGALLTGQQLYDLPFQHYWRSQSRVPDIPTRGYQVIQLLPSIQINGIAVDIDIVRDDKEGGQAQWLCLPKGS
jgi:Domain of unknown function (DUF1906)